MKIGQILDKILVNLEDRERDVILRRYGLKSEAESLHDIAVDYNISRERIRQIQQKATFKLQSLINSNDYLIDFFEKVKKLLQPIGSRSEKSFVKLITQNFNLSESETKIVKFFSIFSRQIVFQKADDIFNNFYSRDNEFNKIVRHSLKKIYFYFIENKEPIPEEKILKIVLKEIKIHLKNTPTREDLIDLLSILKDIDKNPFHFWGLKNHRFIQPKCLKDKIYLVLKNENKPMHFTEIYKKLNSLGNNEDFSPIWSRDYNISSLLNELIRHEDFVLVQRGIYGLKEWGLLDGTAKELIIQILKKKRKISKEKLWQLVSSQKPIQPSSFYIYLKQMKNIKETNGHLIYNG